jgi:hypothetical protein
MMKRPAWTVFGVLPLALLVSCAASPEKTAGFKPCEVRDTSYTGDDGETQIEAVFCQQDVGDKLNILVSVVCERPLTEREARSVVVAEMTRDDNKFPVYVLRPHNHSHDSKFFSYRLEIDKSKLEVKNILLLWPECSGPYGGRIIYVEE